MNETTIIALGFGLGPMVAVLVIAWIAYITEEKT